MTLKTGLGMSVGSESLRILKGKRTREGLLQILEAITVPSPLREDTNSTLLHQEAKRLLKKQKISGNGLAGITGRELILRYVQVPNVSDQRLRAMLAYEVAELSEKIGGDLATDFRLISPQILHAYREERLALVALSKNIFLEKLFRSLQKLRLQTIGALPNSIALFRSFVRHGSFEAEETLLLIHIGKQNIDLSFCRQSKLLFARNLSSGISLLNHAISERVEIPIAEAERLRIQESSLLPGAPDNKVNNAIRYGAGQLLSALKSAISFTKVQLKEPTLKIDRIWICGEGSQQKGLLEYLQQGLGLPTGLFDPTTELDLSLCSESGKQLLLNAPTEWAIPLGLLETVTDDSGFSIQLLPSHFAKKTKFFEGVFFLYLTLLFTLGYLAVHFFTVQKQYALVEHQNKKLLSQKNHLESLQETTQTTQENLRQHHAKLSLLQNQVLPGTHFFRVLSLLNSKIPPSIWIKMVSIKEDQKTLRKVIEIEGVVEESEKDVLQEFLDFTKTLEEDSDIAQCEPTKRERDQEYGRLLFTCRLHIKY